MNFDFGKIMKQAQEMQKKMAGIQDELEQMEITGTAGGGAVVILSNGKFEFKSIKINPDALTDVGLLEDLILAALQDINEQITKLAEDKMSGLTAGLNIPGLKLPF
jgi:nucleoid-associated protein EbfC